MNESSKNNILIVCGAVGVLFLMERLFPLRRQTRPTGHRLFVNALLSSLTFAAAAFVVRPVALWAIHWSDRSSFGLLHWLQVPAGLEFPLGFVLLDLSFYYWHRLCHVVPLLWRFHNVHHLDPDMDVSTGFRFHWGEVLLSTLFRAVQMLLIGTSVSTFAIFELVFQIETYFHHSNLRLPLRLETFLNSFLVSPRMHTIHHSQVHEETDSNYSVIFSLWDKLHGTFRRGIPATDITIGVPGYSKEADNRVRAALLAPFITQHDYWRGLERRERRPA